MAGFIDKLLSGQYPKLEQLFMRGEFQKIVDEVFSKTDYRPEEDEIGGLEDEFEDIDPGLLADLDRLEAQLAEEKSRHEATKRQLDVAKSELKAARYKLDAVQAAMDRAGRWHDEPIG